MAKVLGLTKNNDKYKDVPDGLMWAIPIHEAVSRPHVVAEGKALATKVKLEIEAEKREPSISIAKSDFR